MTMNANKNLTAIGTALILLAAAGAAHADITGQIDATITLESGCIVNGDNQSDGATGIDFGTLDFGTQTTLFSQADTQIQGVGQGITVQCTAGAAPILTFGTGQHDGQGTGLGSKGLQHQTDTAQYVTYDLFADGGYSTVITDGHQITLAGDGSAQTIDVFGRAYGAAGLIEGTYTDIVSVTLEL